MSTPKKKGSPATAGISPKPKFSTMSTPKKNFSTMSTPKPMMAMGGMSKKMGYAKGGMVKANCGASMKPTQKGKK